MLRAPTLGVQVPDPGFALYSTAHSNWNLSKLRVAVAKRKTESQYHETQTKSFYRVNPPSLIRLSSCRSATLQLNSYLRKHRLTLLRKGAYLRMKGSYPPRVFINSIGTAHSATKNRLSKKAQYSSRNSQKEYILIPEFVVLICPKLYARQTAEKVRGGSYLYKKAQKREKLECTAEIMINSRFIKNFVFCQDAQKTPLIMFLG